MAHIALLLSAAIASASSLSAASKSASSSNPAAALRKLAESVRSKLPPNQRSAPHPSDYDKLAYPSAYRKTTPSTKKRSRLRDGVKSDRKSSSSSTHMRGFCNWLIPDVLMVGQYPGQNPESNGPIEEEAIEHIRSVVVDAGMRTFCCLQSEVPAQDDHDAWEAADGMIYLDGYARSMWPKPFTWYAPIVQSAMDEGSASGGSIAEPRYLHVPIQDLTVPESSGEFYDLLHTLLKILDERDSGGDASEGGIYLHCWGGRGRAGLVGSCLLSLIYPELDAKAVLHLVQSGYDSRAGVEHMPDALSQSPQTEEQRDFVRTFVEVNRR